MSTFTLPFSFSLCAKCGAGVNECPKQAAGKCKEPKFHYRLTKRDFSKKNCQSLSKSLRTRPREEKCDFANDEQGWNCFEDKWMD